MNQTTTSPSVDEASASQALSKKDILCGLSLAFGMACIMGLWYCFDNHIPMMDEAGHILNGLGYRELFSHPKPWRADWLVKSLTVNTFYPPTVYIITGLVKTVLGAGRHWDVLVHVYFTFLLTASVFFTSRLLHIPLLAALTSALLINAYPETSSLNHIFMLDFPALSSSAFGIFLLTFWWRYPKWLNAVLCGVLIGYCCLTKQIVAAFLFGTGLFYFVAALRNENRKKLVGQILLLAFSTAAVGAPWLILNYKSMKAINDYAQTNLVSAGQKLTPWQSMLYYLKSYYFTLSPLGCIFFLSSIFAAGKKIHLQLAPIWASALLGFLLMCNYVYPLERYILPSLIIAATVSGAVLANLISNKKMTLKIGGIAISLALIFQYISFNFTPYPISLAPLTVLSQMMGVKLETSIYSRDGTKENPFPPNDWGYDWALDHIKKRDSNAPVYLNVMANKTNLNAQTFDLVTKEQTSPVRATTSRIWSIVGDSYEFDPEKAMYFHYYLVKEGDHGAPWKNKESEQAYEALKTFLTTSGKFEQVDRHKCPDGQDLILYRQTDLKF